jgi:hypothetical protein
MRIPCKIVAEVLLMLKEKIKPGVTSCELEEFALAALKKEKPYLPLRDMLVFRLHYVVLLIIVSFMECPIRHR